MKKIIALSLICLFVSNFYAQTGKRKTRSDKGKTHSHTLNYEIKKAMKPKPEKKKKTH